MDRSWFWFVTGRFVNDLHLPGGICGGLDNDKRDIVQGKPEPTLRGGIHPTSAARCGSGCYGRTEVPRLPNVELG